MDCCAFADLRIYNNYIHLKNVDIFCCLFFGKAALTYHANLVHNAPFPKFRCIFWYHFPVVNVFSVTIESSKYTVQVVQPTFVGRSQLFAEAPGETIGTPARRTTIRVLVAAMLARPRKWATAYI